jgi:putative ABC transport system permease protein
MGYLVRMAARNLARNSRRSFLSALAIVIALAMIVFAQGFVRGILDGIADNTARLKTGHIRVAAEEYLRQERLLPLSEAVPFGPDVEALVDSTPGIAARAGRIRFGVLLNNDDKSEPAMGLAIEPAREAGILRLPEFIARGEYLSGADNEVVLGRGLAGKLGVGVGDTLVLITRTAYGSPTGANLVVRGIVNSGIGQVDQRHFFITVAAAQQLLDLSGMVSEVIIMLKDRTQASALAAGLQERLLAAGHDRLAARSYRSDPMMALFSMAEAVYFLIYIIILLVASTAIINTMLMVVFERTREIGMMKALGMTDRSVIGVLVLESTLIGLAGSIAGVALGGLVVVALSGPGIDFSGALGGDANPTLIGGVVRPTLTALAVVSSFFLGLLLSAIVGVVATRRVSKLSPAEALRTI